VYKRQPKRVSKLREYLSELAEIQSLEDLNPVKSFIDPSDVRIACDKLNTCLQNIICLLKTLCENQIADSINSILETPGGLNELMSHQSKSSNTSSRQRILFGITRISSWLSFAEYRIGLPSVTIDTNCFVHYANEGEQSEQVFQDVETLITACATGQISLVGTTRIEADLSRDANDERRKRQLKKLNSIPIIPSIMRLDISQLDQDLLAEKEDEAIEKMVKEILFPGLSQDDPKYNNKICDVDHVAAHYTAMRDYFVTEDSDILKKQVALKNKEIIVLNTNDCLIRLLEK
jgi:hypothetical protein